MNICSIDTGENITEVPTVESIKKKHGIRYMDDEYDRLEISYTEYNVLQSKWTRWKHRVFYFNLARKTLSITEVQKGVFKNEEKTH